jgi:hypothetical protein
MAASPQEPTIENQYATTMNSKDGGLKVTYTSEPEAIPIGPIISWKLKVVTAAGEPVKDAERSRSHDLDVPGAERRANVLCLRLPSAIYQRLCQR